MTDEPAETLKRDANENPWYWLATLYGEPAWDDRELQARNRVAWNRYMAGRLTEDARTKLVEERRHPAEELAPFSPDELDELAHEFKTRAGSFSAASLPILEEKIDFSDVQFGSFFSSNFLFASEAEFSRATFSQHARFINTEMKSETSFKGAIFEIEPPRFFGAKLYEGTVWLDVTWPPAPKDAAQAGNFVAAYERLKLEMDRLKKHEDELDFFARELQSRRALNGDWKPVSEVKLFGRIIPVRPLNVPELTFPPKWLNRSAPTFTLPARTIPLYRPASGLGIALYGLLCDFGRSYVRPLCGLLLTAAAGTLAFWPWFGLFKVKKALGLSVANTFGVLGFRKDFISSQLLDALPGMLKVFSAVQTVAGAVLLFLFSLALRNRFRMK